MESGQKLTARKGALRIVIAGGGTGGHLFPALAIAEEFRRRDKSTEIIFAGAERGLETSVVPARGYRLELFDVEGIKKRKGLERLGAITKALRATMRARKWLKDLRPDGVIGSGSYSSGPVVLAARLLGIKTMILEQNAVPGLTNRMLGRLASRVYIAFEEAARYFPKARTLISGNPVRKDILCAVDRVRHRANGRFSLFVFGGSQGATAINAAFIDATEYLTDIWNSLHVVHQTGKEGFGAAEGAYKRKGLKVEVRDFIEDMASVYATSDLVVCRAGATSIAEITSLGLPAIFIPYPFSTDDHQEVNARTLEKKGAAMMIRQDELTGSVLASAIRRFYEDRETLDRVRRSIRRLARPGATEAVVDDCLGLIRGG